MGKKLIEFICPRCNRRLIWADENANVYCKVCDRWVAAKDLKEKNPLRIDATKDKEQLELFPGTIK